VENGQFHSPSIAMEKGVQFGRKKIVIDERFIAAYDRWKAGELTAVAAMKVLEMNRNTFYRRVKEYEATLLGER
jgi:hypothetical protein